MKLSRLLSLTTAAAGTAAAVRVLTRRYQWEQTNNRAAICVDFDDAQAAAIRAGLALDEMFPRLAAAGATHISLPEWTLNRLMASGALTPQAPPQTIAGSPPIGHWNYLHGSPGLVASLAQELSQRMPQTEGAVLAGTTLAFAGDVPTVGEVGLGFDTELATRIKQHGLGIVPRPVSYAWPDPVLLKRTLTQAAQVGHFVAFAGDMILGHEMHLDATVQALAQNELTFVYFAESRHQKGDWFIAKRRAPHVVLGHRLSPADMVPLDYHAACHNWAYFARERGIRFCYVNFFRVLHATAPLEGLDYVHHLKHALEDAGLVVSADIDPPRPIPAPDTTELAAAGVAVAGVGATAVSGLLDLPESLAVPLTLVSAAGAAALPFLEQARNQKALAALNSAHQHDRHDHDHDHSHSHDDHDHDHSDLHALYPPSYTPKILGLGAAAFGPVVAAGYVGPDEILYHLAATVALAAATSGPEYQLRIEEYRGFNFDWFVPLAAAVWPVPDKRLRAAALATLAIGWLVAKQRGIDVLAQIDPGHAEGHTHHISTAMALLGDLQMAVGPKPARKWSGLGPSAGGAAELLASTGHGQAATVGHVFSALGYALGLVGFRRPERALAETWRLTGPSLAAGLAAGAALSIAARITRNNRGE